MALPAPPSYTAANHSPSSSHSLAAAFTTLVKSFVSDILMPPISVILPLNRNIEEKFAVLKRGSHYDSAKGYNTLQQAQADGAVVMAYGSFINQIVSFMGVGVALYFLAEFYQWLSKDPIIKHTKKCQYCRTRINEKVRGREDRRGSRGIRGVLTRDSA